MTADITDQTRQAVYQTLRQVWGFHNFRPQQAEMVATILGQQDLLGMLPTGGGKSLCFQLPALLQDGLTLVVSPLVALMENQVADLERRGVAAALFHSERSRQDRGRLLQALQAQQLKLLYLSPESLLSAPMWACLLTQAVRINRLVVDEAHCISQWGTQFRPVYRRLGAVRTALEQAQPTPVAIAAFTATAPPAVQAEIQQVLGLRQARIIQKSPYRRNLFLRTRRVWTPAQRRRLMVQFMQAQGPHSGLVYVRSRADSETIAHWLQQQGYGVRAYHAGLAPQQRRQIEQDWLTGCVPIVICTSAFGMGVDKADVRWICHFQPPSTLSEYLQEVGRAGRDGNAAQALLLASEPTGLLDPSDRQRQRQFQQQQLTQQRQAQRLIQRLPAQGNIQDLGQEVPGSEMALALLHQQGALTWQDPFHYRLSKTLALQSPVSHSGMADIGAYLATRTCRWQFLLHAFGFSAGGSIQNCGHCDRCQ